MEETLGKVDFDAEIQKRFQKLFVPHWFTVDIKIGVRSAQKLSVFRSCGVLGQRIAAVFA